ncbi:MAG: oligosaccharide flippase family protein, partial [Candidatus Brocadiia bacterium]
MSVVARAKSILHRLPEIVDLRGHDKRAPGELSLKARFARGAFWSLLGAVISRAIAFISSVMVARMLGAEGFGEFGIVQSTVFMFGVFAGFGMGLTATKFVAQYRTTDPSRAGNIIGLTLVVSAATGALLAIALFVLAPWLADKTLHAPQITPLLRMASAYLFLTALNGAQIGALAGFEAYRKLMWVSIVSGIATFPLVIAGTWFFGVQGAILASVGGAVIAWAITGFALRTAAKQA